MSRVDRAALAAELTALGAAPGATVLVHASMRAVGCGPDLLLDGLRDVLGDAGTVVALTSTEANSTTSREFRRATEGMSRPELAAHLDRMPAFDRLLSPTSLGAFAEHVRTEPKAFRSDHPQTSFSAVGALAEWITAGHGADCHHGERSPLARLYECGAHVLALGVGYRTCTAFHLAEYRYTPSPPTRPYSCVLLRHGEREWWTYTDVVLDDSCFEEMGAAMDREEFVVRGRVGMADSRWIPLPKVVDFAARHLAELRLSAIVGA